MNKRVISAMVSLSMAVSMCGGFAVTARAAEAKTPKYQTTARQMEELNRGLVATYVTVDNHAWYKAGVYLSWRLLGTESLTNQAFDIYKNGTLLATTGAADATNYVDETGTATDTYKVVKAGAGAKEVEAEKAVTPGTNYTAKGSEVSNGNSHINSFTYIDIPISRPEPVERMGDGKLSYYYTLDKDHEGGANDASVGDLDGDGDYEIVLKWDPTDSKDSAGADFTGNAYIDAYEINTNTDNLMWRIDLGKNVTAGAHYTQFMVYDFDGDGKSEIAMKTAPGSIDGTGKYVTEVGDTDEIRNVDNTASFIGTSGRLKGKNPFTQYLTIFDGETGAALWTTEFIPYDAAEDKYWGDGSAKYNRSERYLAAVAYLDGVHPSIIMCRGYYHDSVIRAYNWDGSELAMLWEHVGKASAKDTTLYGQGNHNLSIADIDNDGKDEIVYGSACLDDDGKTVLGNTYLGHGDAMHVNDFNNDGMQEVFSVKEDEYKKYAMDLRVASTGVHFWEEGKVVTSGDNGRGVMDNIDDEYAKTHSNALAIGWDSGHSKVIDLNGDEMKTKPSTAGNGTFDNFLVFWDGDLSRELLDANIIQKYDAANGWTKRFYGPSDGYSLTGGSTNNYTKRTPSLVADLWGDWREEIIMPINKGSSTEQAYLRIFTSTIPTDYRLTTLMHDCQYREAIAWQNVAYNQPPHTSYYVGSVALAADESGNTLNYLAPAVPYTNVVYEIENKAVTGIKLSHESISVEKGEQTAINAVIEPADATKKSVKWTSSNDAVATVSGGIVKGVSDGKARITAETRDGGFTATCEVTVYTNHPTGIKLSENSIELGIGNSKTLTASVSPDEATDKSVKWTSADEAIAAVSEDGLVTGVSKGTTTVTAETVDGGIKAECTVKVFPLQVTDETGSDSFVCTNTDSRTTYTLSPTSASIVQDKATVPVIASKRFKAYSDNKASISLRLNTGGDKENGSYIWKLGHTYKSGLKFIDTEGKSILEIYDVHKNSSDTGVSTMYKLADSEEKSAGGWTKTADGADSPFGRSQIRWQVKLDFDYDNDMCTVSLSGCNSSWEANATYETTFKLNGQSFETLQYFTSDYNDYVSVKPAVTEVKYERTVALAPRDKIGIKSVEGKKANLNVTFENDRAGIDIIGALYNSDGIPVEIVKKTLENVKTTENAETPVEESIEFTKDINDYKLKVFMWNSLGDLVPACRYAEYVYTTPDPNATPTPEPTAIPTPSPSPSPTPVVAQAKLNMTYVDYNNADTAAGYLTENLKSGYNAVSADGTITFPNKEWSCSWVTYVKADVSEALKNGESVKSAKLKFDASGAGDSSRTRKAIVGIGTVPYTDWNDTLTYNIAAANDMNKISTIGDAVTGTAERHDSFDTYEFDITDTLKADADGIVTLVIYETAAGGSDIKNVSVEAETTTAKMANVTLKYVNESGEQLADDVIKQYESGHAVQLTDSDRADIIKDGVKYVYNYDKSSVSEIVKEDGTTVLTLVYVEDEKYIVKLSGAGDDGADLGVIYEKPSYGNSSVVIPYPRYIIKDGALYTYGPTGGDKQKEYNEYMNVEDANVSGTLTYTKLEEKGLFYQEAETFFDAVTVDNAAIRCSMGSGGAVSGKRDALKLSAGTYKITAAVWGGSKDETKQTKFVIAAGGNTVEITADTNWNESATPEFTLTEDTLVTVEAVPSGGSPSPACLDYILVTGTGTVEIPYSAVARGVTD